MWSCEDGREVTKHRKTTRILGFRLWMHTCLKEKTFAYLSRQLEYLIQSHKQTNLVRVH